MGVRGELALRVEVVVVVVTRMPPRVPVPRLLLVPLVVEGVMPLLVEGVMPLRVEEVVEDVKGSFGLLEVNKSEVDEEDGEDEEGLPLVPLEEEWGLRRRTTEEGHCSWSVEVV